MDIGNSPHRHSIIKYPNIFGAGANQIPVGSFILSATLSLVLQVDGAGSTDCPSVYRLTEDWTEGDATWNERSVAVPWSSAGADGPGSHTGVREGYFPCTGGGTVNMDVTASVQAWSNGDLNAGWVFINSPSAAATRYRTSEHIPGSLPILTVQYGAVTDFSTFRNITVDRTKIPGTCGATTPPSRRPPRTLWACGVRTSSACGTWKRAWWTKRPSPTSTRTRPPTTTTATRAGT